MGMLTPLEPDHLCSLIALNMTSLTAWSAFLGGAQWGIGHAAGMILFCIIFLPLQRLITLTTWEAYGNYVAGSLLIGIGVYFLHAEAKYLEKGADGTWAPRVGACACYGHEHHHMEDHESHSHCHPNEVGDDEEGMKTPLLRKEADVLVPDSMNLKRGLIGLLQGLCCPSCMAGMAFVGQVGSERPQLSGIIFFFFSMVVSLVFCSALMSAASVALGQSCSSQCRLSARTTFRAACIFSIILGIIWIVLQHTGQLRILQYTDRFESRMTKQMNMTMAGHVMLQN